MLIEELEKGLMKRREYLTLEMSNILCKKRAYIQRSIRLLKKTVFRLR